MKLEGKTVVIGVSAGIAAYKICYLVSHLKQDGAEVHVLMTENAVNFVDPLTFETLSGNRCVYDTFARDFDFDVQHVSIAKKADLFMVAPATADIIAKLAYGIADDMLTTTFLAAKCPKYVSPSMNTQMFENAATQRNIQTLKELGINVIDPASGHLACGDTGAGKMPEPEFLFDIIVGKLGREQDLKGRRVLVTCGATQEALDPVRFITNHSTGKMGIAIAEEARDRGAEVTLVRASTKAPDPAKVDIVPAISAEEMYNEVTSKAGSQDIIVMAAAVADYRPKVVSGEKIKKTGDGIELSLERTKDILATLGEMRSKGELPESQKICGFSMETENLLENSRKKLEKKNCDMIVANNLKEEGAGFGHDTNKVAVITKEDTKELALMTKRDVARAIFDEILLLEDK